ncbi:hypothetical protein PR202_gb14318 [Eleusine coracana subsp. coracana]|uniref:BTB domain-containing protein n=1 Tax=Eleusine coracana subsp. coracana TaxID=191504 RepID=A0AAV5EV25_ELECO|nr:hypothetical protein PR202_gb14318 [Eleusine coracana subsp. coracana]
MKKKPAQGIQVDDVDPAIFEALLHFIYTDSLPKKCNINDSVIAQQLLVAADQYGLERLRTVCEDKLSRSMDVKTVERAADTVCHMSSECCEIILGWSQRPAACMSGPGVGLLLLPWSWQYIPPGARVEAANARARQAEAPRAVGVSFPDQAGSVFRSPTRVGRYQQPLD